MKRPRITHTDRPMHQVRRVDSGDLWWWGYFLFTRRTFYLFGLAVWYRDFDEEERPITDLIRKAVGS